MENILNSAWKLQQKWVWKNFFLIRNITGRKIKNIGKLLFEYIWKIWGGE